MLPWLALDHSPLSAAIRQVAEAFELAEAWHVLKDGTLDPSHSPPEYCVCVGCDHELALELLKKHVPTYALASPLPDLVGLLDPDTWAKSGALSHLTAKAASELLHKWNRQAHRVPPLADILQNVLDPLVWLKYLDSNDLRALRKPSLNPQVIQAIIERICRKLNSYG